MRLDDVDRQHFQHHCCFPSKTRFRVSESRVAFDTEFSEPLLELTGSPERCEWLHCRHNNLHWPMRLNEGAHLRTSYMPKSIATVASLALSFGSPKAAWYERRALPYCAIAVLRKSVSPVRLLRFAYAVAAIATERYEVTGATAYRPGRCFRTFIQGVNSSGKET